jgi:arylsulfatase A-like enzyme
MRNMLCPGLDQTFTALLEDLESRGVLDETLVVCMSEHGRTPTVKSGPRIFGGGRDHWSRVYSMILAGGGIAKGRVVGRSDRTGGDVLETPVSPKDVLATMYHLLGIDPHGTMTDRQGRPQPIAGEGRVRWELID